MSDRDIRREAAQACYGTAHSIVSFTRFEADFLDLPRRLFLEVALEQASKPTLRVLDIGCGTGSGLMYLRTRLPDAELVGIDPEGGMVAVARQRLRGNAMIIQSSIETLPIHTDTFDLVLSHSNFRLWTDPVAGLRNIQMLLSPGGLAYILDLRRDVIPQTHEQLRQHARGDVARQLLETQLEAAYTQQEIADLVGRAGISHYQLSVGGLAGQPVWCIATIQLLRRNRHIAGLVSRLMHEHDGNIHSHESLIHLFIYGCGGVRSSETAGAHDFKGAAL